MKNRIQIQHIALLLVFLVGCTANGGSIDDLPEADTAAADAYTGDSVEFDLYVMSQCPYGTQVEDALVPVKERLGGALDLDIEFIGSEPTPGVFKSLHGEPEVQGNLAQLCVKDLAPDMMLDFIACQNKNPRDLEGSIDSCAESLGLDPAEVRSCADGERGKELLSASFKEAIAASARGSPTIVIDGQPYQGARDSLSLLRASCAKLDGHPACSELPACAADSDCTAEPNKIGLCENPGKDDAKCTYKDPVAFDMIVLSDERCTSCNPSQVSAALKQYFLGANVQEMDVSEAADLIEANGITRVPAVLVGSEVTEAKSWSIPQIKAAFEKTDFGYKLKDSVTGARYLIDDTAREAQLAELGVQLNDNTPQVDFFVMSYCPYGNQAEEALEPVFEKLEGSAEFNPHYVIYSGYGDAEKNCYNGDSEYCSMHGKTELHQDLREHCVRDIYGMQSWFDFALAMNKQCDHNNADTCWAGAAEKLELDTAQIESCFEEKSPDFLAKDAKLNDAYAVQGSPTVFIDGELYGGPRSPQGYMAALCAAFDEAPAECDGIEELPAVTTSAAAIGGGCAV